MAAGSGRLEDLTLQIESSKSGDVDNPQGHEHGVSTASEVPGEDVVAIPRRYAASVAVELAVIAHGAAWAHRRGEWHQTPVEWLAAVMGRQHVATVAAKRRRMRRRDGRASRPWGFDSALANSRDLDTKGRPLSVIASWEIANDGSREPSAASPRQRPDRNPWR